MMSTLSDADHKTAVLFIVARKVEAPSKQHLASMSGSSWSEYIDFGSPDERNALLDEISGWPPEKIESTFSIEKDLYGREFHDLAIPLSVERVGAFTSSLWVPYEIACLVSGFEPNRRLVEWAQRYVDFDLTSAKITLAHDIVHDGLEAGAIKIGMNKSEILKIFDDQGFVVDDVLFKAISDPKALSRAHLLQKLDKANKTIAKQKASASSLTQIDKKFLLTLIAALAIGKWNYDTEAGKNEATAIMLKVIKKAGVQTTAETLLKHINQGLKLLDAMAGSDSQA